ncbi:hypothetical protein [Aeromonas sp. QDB63]|uniref:hypothetical protein n=1 Tax=Aeromonas sp. QDB63 TaxID=2989825 RepID=UPI0022E90243|nr:hypothetical protein [Aeromonas sp. QDB63]
MAENGPIEELAKIISKEIFDRFLWKRVGPGDQDFDCVNEAEHKPQDKAQKHTHPVDVVFSYKDPYLNKTIYLNTDLKSYSKKTITVKKIEDALISLANTIDCATYSEFWEEKYITEVGNYDIRGLLFIYNHDNEFTHNFYHYFNPPKPEGKARRPNSINTSRINIKENQQIHIIEPGIINYMMTLLSDMDSLIAKSEFPSEGGYGFFYPQLTYHKILVNEQHLPATIELLTSPFLIIKHDEVMGVNTKTMTVELKNAEGYIVYYNRSGDTDLEFMYLFELLANYQILNFKNKIKIRIASLNRSASIISNYKRAVEKYAHEWGYDSDAKKYLDNIELFLIPTVKSFYSSEALSWE